MSVSIVVPTVGRPSLAVLLDALSKASPREILLVDDRRRRQGRLPGTPRPNVRVLAGPGRGPAAARNLGWRTATASWIAFLDDDVVPEPGWWEALCRDLDVGPQVGGVQGIVRVPLPAGRRPTDWERNTAALEGACWITADMAYRTSVLEAVGGFDERFRRAYREDTDLAVRVRRAGVDLVRGTRSCLHPVRPAGPWTSVRSQAGNADDVLMRRLHGPQWRVTGDVGGTMRWDHVVTTALAILVVTGPARRAATAAWVGLAARFAWSRISPGPRTPEEVARMLATSVLIPPVATAYRCWALVRPVRSTHVRSMPG
jgi:glycosyltransferase involved in cell wall biosynthesis